MTVRAAVAALVLALVAGCGDAPKRATRSQCRTIGRHGAVRYELCYRPGRPNAHGTFVAVSAGRSELLPVHPPVRPGPGTPVVGHWSSATMMRDGKTLVATWSGECESTSRYRISIATGAARKVQPQRPPC